MSAAEQWVLPPLFIRDAMPGDTWLILPNVRQPDVDELAALGATPEDCIRTGLEFPAHIAFIYDEPAAVFGVTEQNGVRVPWAVFTTAIDRHPLIFLRGSKRIADTWEGPLLNYVDARNVLTIKWLKWLGFEVDESEPLGINGELFHRFHRCATSG